MATIKVKFRTSTVSNKEGALFYQVIHNRVVRQINTGYKLFPSEWDGLKQEVIIGTLTDDTRSKYLQALVSHVYDETLRLKNIILHLERSGVPYSAEKVIELYNAPSDSNSFISFTNHLITQLTKVGKKRTAEKYQTSLNSFMRFRKDKDVLLDDVNEELMMEYESYLKEERICPNSSSYYMRNLRAIYNRAVEKGLTSQSNPFKYVYTGIDKTVKRAVPIKTIREIKQLDLSLHPSMNFARDMFMFSFYTRGMSFVDMAFLKKSDLQNGILCYRRKKTNQQLFIKWEKPMQEIVSRYDTGHTTFLLPIITDMEKDEVKQYRNMAHFVNAQLRKLGEQIGLEQPLTTYVARHTWASIARIKNVSISTISEAMGHDSEKTTRIYLATLDTSAIDKANSTVIKAL